ncbi:acyltransferase [Caballeronia terrestris]|uniref:Acyltransferase n=1 Tax=Caballeronia terrestris TaxID=1226301 RepID=A0A158L3I4_9BURK|nr:acyltransferase family protein [Caballeronia terrestris]SAL87795.1 acyltransferase [Caballeronia terrestris]
MPDPVIHAPGIPVLLVGLVAFGLATAIVRASAFYSTLVAKEISQKRFHAIDGLRGYLALGVVFHHIIINLHYYQTGVWGLTASRLTTFLGRGSVAFFFMITAFLFWSRALDALGHLDSYRFYVSRLRRMVPMYVVSAALVIFTALALTHFHQGESISDLIRHT